MNRACSKTNEFTCIKFLLGLPEENRLLGRLKRRLVDNNDMGHEVLGWEEGARVI
jgi:hypothetical protein